MSVQSFRTELSSISVMTAPAALTHEDLQHGDATKRVSPEIPLMCRWHLDFF